MGDKEELVIQVAVLMVGQAQEDTATRAPLTTLVTMQRQRCR